MKTVFYTADALNDLRAHRAQAKAIMAKIQRYAQTGAGDVKPLVQQGGAKRLRIGDYRPSSKNRQATSPSPKSAIDGTSIAKVTR